MGVVAGVWMIKVVIKGVDVEYEVDVDGGMAKVEVQVMHGKGVPLSFLFSQLAPRVQALMF